MPSTFVRGRKKRRKYLQEMNLLTQRVHDNVVKGEEREAEIEARQQAREDEKETLIEFSSQ